MPLFDYERGDSSRGAIYEGVDIEDRVENGAVETAVSSTATPGRSTRKRFPGFTRSCSGMSKWSIFFISLAAVLLVATATYVGIKVSQEKKQSASVTAASTDSTTSTAPSMSPVRPTREQQLQELIRTVVSDQELADKQSPQYKAFKWILTQDPRQVSGDDPDLLQRYALATLYYSTNGIDTSVNSWVNNKGWLTSEHECGWFGVECDATNSNNLPQQFGDYSLPTPKSKGEVTRINLTSNGLVGSLPQQIIALHRLKALDLNHNKLSGTLFNVWGNLTKLIKLIFDHNNLSGEIPGSLSMLKNLSLLDLGYNNFSGTFPQAICDSLSLDSYGEDLDTSVPNLDCGCACAENTTDALTSLEITTNASTSWLSAQINPFPSGTSSVYPSGDVSVEIRNDIRIIMNVSYLESLCTPSKANGCGIHIHEGVSCNSTDQVLGHYWNTGILGDSDPWTSVTFMTNEAGISNESIVLLGGNGYSMEQNNGHAIVIHDMNGTKIGCGILVGSNYHSSEDLYDTTEPASSVIVCQSICSDGYHCENGKCIIDTNTGDIMASAQIEAFPNITSSFYPSGDVLVYFSSDIRIKMNVSGLESLCTPSSANGCGIHIHEGVSCDNKEQVMGHYWNSTALGESDPWTNVTYTTNEDGISGETIMLMGGNGYSIEENNGHAVVIHDQNGTKFGCGILVVARSKGGFQK